MLLGCLLFLTCCEVEVKEEGSKTITLETPCITNDEEAIKSYLAKNIKVVCITGKFSYSSTFKARCILNEEELGFIYKLYITCME